MSTLRDHLRKYPNARPQTIAYLVKQDAIHQELRRGLEMPKLSLFRKLLAWIGRR